MHNGFFRPGSLLSFFIFNIAMMVGCGQMRSERQVTAEIESPKLLQPQLDSHSLIVSSSFYNQSFSVSTGKLILRANIVPQSAPLDAVVGISNGVADAYSDLAVIVRLNPQGVFDARDAAAYRADVSLRYQPLVNYQIRFEVDVMAKTYSVFVKPGSNAEVRLAHGYKFRSEQASLNQLNNLASVVIAPARIDLSGVQKVETSVNGVIVGAVIPPPANSTLIANFNIAEAAKLLAAGTSAWIPLPWLADHCGPNSLLASVDLLRFRQIIRDGCRWTPLYNPSATFNYARAEVALASTPKIPANVKSWIEWRGYFPQNLPAYSGSGPSVMIAPFQIHNDNGVSPMYALSINNITKKIQLDIHDINGKYKTKVDLADYASFVNRVRTIRVGYIPSSSTTGYVNVELDGVQVYEAKNIQSSNTPGRDYVKFGLYDWGRAYVSPTQASRGRVFEMVTESFKLYRAQ